MSVLFPEGARPLNRPHRSLASRVGYWIVVLLLLAGGIVMVFPLFWLVSTSFRPASELNVVPPHLLP
jgi:ABC-type glycerol-3-phosphate transport system permease component